MISMFGFHIHLRYGQALLHASATSNPILCLVEVQYKLIEMEPTAGHYQCRWQVSVQAPCSGLVPNEQLHHVAFQTDKDVQIRTVLVPRQLALATDSPSSKFLLRHSTVLGPSSENRQTLCPYGDLFDVERFGLPVLWMLRTVVHPSTCG